MGSESRERRFDLALEAERRGSYGESFALSRDLLLENPSDAAALQLLARLCRLAGDFPAASKALYAAAVAERPDIADHHLAPPALRPFEGIDAVAQLIEGSIAADPENAEAVAAHGNLLVRRTLYLDACKAYRRAIELRPDFAPAQLMLSELLAVLHDRSSSDAHRSAALRIQAIYPQALAGTAVPHVLVLVRNAPYSVNAPFDLLVDPERLSLRRLYVDADAAVDALPVHDAILNGIGYAEGAQAALCVAATWMDRSAAPHLNDPDRVSGLSREQLRESLASVPNCMVPETTRIERGARPTSFPAIVRPVDTHAGEGLAAVRDAGDLERYYDRRSEGFFHAAPFVEYRNDDGYYRKFRVVIVDGKPFPYHLAVDSSWMVHYNTSLMDRHKWMREEEAAFLDSPEAFFPTWKTTFEALATATGLDYFGVDVSVLSDGSVLVFEADPAMLVHDEEPAGPFAYKRASFARIVRAFESMVRKAMGAR